MSETDCETVKDTLWGGGPEPVCSRRSPCVSFPSKVEDGLVFRMEVMRTQRGEMVRRRPPYRGNIREGLRNEEEKQGGSGQDTIGLGSGALHENV
jgi:hypothetical protein